MRGVITTADIKKRDRVVGVSRAFMVSLAPAIQAASSLLNVAILVK